MQEIHNNNFFSKKRNTTLFQVQTGKHKCRYITGIRAYLFSSDEELCYVILTRNYCWEFLAPHGIILHQSRESNNNVQAKKNLQR